VASESATGVRMGEGVAEYPGFLGIIWRRRDWPIRVTLLVCVGSEVIPFIASGIRAALKSDQLMGFTTFPWIGVIGGSGALGYFLWQLWKGVCRPYIASLYGFLTAAQVPWRTVIIPPHPQGPSLRARWPWLLPAAMALVVGMAAVFAYRDAQWLLISKRAVGVATTLTLPTPDMALLTDGSFVTIIGLSQKTYQRSRFPYEVPSYRMAISPDGHFVVALAAQGDLAQQTQRTLECLAISELIIDPTPRFDRTRWVGYCTPSDRLREVAVSSQGIIAAALVTAESQTAEIALWTGAGWRSIADNVPWSAGQSLSLQFSADGQCLGWLQPRVIHVICRNKAEQRVIAVDPSVVRFALGPGLIAVTSRGIPQVSVLNDAGLPLSHSRGLKFLGPPLDSLTAFSADGTLLGYVGDEDLHVWRWRRRDYGTVIRQILGLRTG
jgi:hypothetical protein